MLAGSRFRTSAGRPAGRNIGTGFNRTVPRDGLRGRQRHGGCQERFVKRSLHRLRDRLIGPAAGQVWKQGSAGTSGSSVPPGFFIDVVVVPQMFELQIRPFEPPLQHGGDVARRRGIPHDDGLVSTWLRQIRTLRSTERRSSRRVRFAGRAERTDPGTDETNTNASIHSRRPIISAIFHFRRPRKECRRPGKRPPASRPGRRW